ncbi:hypothetical protein [Avibacterium sp. 20-129]|uniref:hypothetical protein n=1 Tax=Avibacterium sp. 20-129 TaxID=2911525 RepID=UPI00224724B7|nr:hypothetical protein [Avibacterium sp. 20-129]MCW9699220.1 hypothetical protein [Avibacterium sp. 20-129]
MKKHLECLNMMIIGFGGMMVRRVEKSGWVSGYELEFVLLSLIILLSIIYFSTLYINKNTIKLNNPFNGLNAKGRNLLLFYFACCLMIFCLCYFLGKKYSLDTFLVLIYFSILGVILSFFYTKILRFVKKNYSLDKKEGAVLD